MDRIGLIAAMPMEIAPILEKIHGARTERASGQTFVQGTIGGVPVIAGCCGVGKVNAAMGAQAMICRYAPKLMLHFGVGGSLTPRLGIGDVLVARDCVQYDVDTTALGDPLGFVSTVERVDFPCDPAAVRALTEAAETLKRDGIRVELGRIATGDRFLTRADEKQAIVRAFGALTCDQESCAVAQVCRVNAVPCAVIRAVSDASDGVHGDEYQSYAPRAAATAARLALLFIERFGKEFVESII